MLDAGFYNFLIPFVQSAAEAKAAVAATRYPPAGVRDVSVSQRSNKYGMVENYMTRVNDEICVIVQIENRAGIEAAAEIAAIDGLFVGPSDLAAALGHLGNPGHPEVQQAIRGIVAQYRHLPRAVQCLRRARRRGLGPFGNGQGA